MLTGFVVKKDLPLYHCIYFSWELCNKNLAEKWKSRLYYMSLLIAGGFVAIYLRGHIGNIFVSIKITMLGLSIMICNLQASC